MARVFFASAGTGPGVEEAIAFSARESHPELMVFLTTEASRVTVDRVMGLLGGSGPSWECCEVAESGDIEACYERAVAALRDLRERGYNPTEVTCDITSGTKPMSAGLALAAQAMGCSVLSYVDGKRGSNGRVIGGTERLVRLRPIRVWLDHYRAEFVALFNRFQFDACLNILRQMRSLTRVPEHTWEIDCLSSLTMGYSAWDKFDHQAAQEHFKGVRLGVLEHWSLNWEANRGFLARVVRSKDRFGGEALCDLLLNACRRREEGKYDDAVARLYRLIEMVAQGALTKHGVNTADVDPDALPQSIRSMYAARRSPDTGKIVLGLQEDCRVLAALGDPLGQAFLGNLRMRDLLSKRNLSILAHGTTSVTKDDGEALEAEVRTLMDCRVQRFDRLLGEGAFPKLEIR